MVPTVQWQGDNTAEVERLLTDHLVRADKRGAQLHLTGIGINVLLDLGDSILLDGDSLGIQRGRGKKSEPHATWRGHNVREFATLLNDFKVNFMVIGENLHCIAPKETIVLRRGDMLIDRNGQIIVSVAGQDHRV